jgi:hypothetical protein
MAGNNTAHAVEETAGSFHRITESTIAPADADDAGTSDQEFEDALREGEASLPEITVTGAKVANGVKTLAEQNDPYNPKNFLVDEGAEVVGKVKKVITTVPVRKPNRQEWIRVNSNPAYRMAKVFLLALQGQMKVAHYLVLPKFAPIIESDIITVTMLTAYSRTGGVFLWPIRLANNGDEGISSWSESALEAANIAQEAWVRVKSNMPAQQYDVDQAVGELPVPEWPEEPLSVLLRKAFGKRIIDNEKHPAILTLQGAL